MLLLIFAFFALSYTQSCPQTDLRDDCLYEKLYKIIPKDKLDYYHVKQIDVHYRENKAILVTTYQCEPELMKLLKYVDGLKVYYTQVIDGPANTENPIDCSANTPTVCILTFEIETNLSENPENTYFPTIKYAIQS
jgi:hypothetical protein